MPTICGPPATLTRVFSRSSILFAVSDMFLSDAALSASPPTCAANTRSPSIVTSIWWANSSPIM